MKTLSIANYILSAGALLVLLASIAAAEETGHTSSTNVDVAYANIYVWNEPMTSEEATTAFSTRLDVAYVSKYVARGLVVNPDGSFQHSLTISHSSGFSFNFWGNLDTTDVAGAKGKFTEHDYTLNYAWSCDNKDYNAGYAYYAFPNSSCASTSEVYGSVCFGGSIYTTLCVNYDIDEANGFYAAISGNCALPLKWRTSAAPTLNLSGKIGLGSSGYNEFCFPTDRLRLTHRFALVDATFGASMPYAIDSKWSLTPAISYSMVIDRKLRDSVNKPDNLVVSLALSCAL